MNIKTIAMKNNVSAVWMDAKTANIFATADRSSIGEFDLIATEVCDNHDNAVFKNERVEQSRDDQEQKKYFKAIAAHVQNDDTIFIFGPGKAQEQFKNFLEDYQNFNTKQIELGTSDKISEGEMAILASNHFN
jgi:stalled ribosome rescue protein Dom34